MNDKIELISCPRQGTECQHHRVVINRDFHESQTFLLNKDYSNSILALKDAYHKTTELHTTSCHSCAELFRLSITKSLENIHADLHKMSTGMFGTKRFRSSLELAGVVLSEIKSNTGTY